MKIQALQINLSKEEKIFIMNKIETILDSKNKWTNSEVVSEFEKEFKEISKAKYTVATSTGSAAIEASLIALGIQGEDSIIFAPNLTAPPTILSSLHNGSKVVLVDSSKEDFGMDKDDLLRKIKKYDTKGKKCIIPVHIGGIISKDIYDIIQIAKNYNMNVIEDCAHSHGSTLDNKYAGSFGDVGTFSYFLTKTLTSGEGGIITTNSSEINDKLRIIRNYGKDNNGDHVVKGSSWRMNEFTAAVALQQTLAHDRVISERSDIAHKYDKYFEESKYFKKIKLSEKSGYYKYIIIVENVENFDSSLFNESMLKEFNIQMPGLVYRNLCNKEPYLKNNKNILNVNDYFSNGVYLSKNHICLPLYPGLKEYEITYIVESMNKCILKFA